MATENIEERVRSLRERKDGALEALVEEYTGPLMGAAFALGFSEGDAEELVQDTFVALLAALERFEMRSKLKTYVFGILYNKARTLRRKQSREEAFDFQDPDFAQRFDARGMWVAPPKGPEDAALTDEIRAWVRRCSEHLPLQQRAALFLKEIDGEDSETVRDVLNVSPANLRVLLHRARIKLRDCLEKNWEQGR